MCGPGYYSTGNTNACTQCGDEPAIYDQTLWDQTQSAVASSTACRCRPGLTGSNCELAACFPTTSAAVWKSTGELGFRRGHGDNVASMAWKLHAIEQTTQLRKHVASMAWAPEI